MCRYLCGAGHESIELYAFPRPKFIFPFLHEKNVHRWKAGREYSVRCRASGEIVHLQESMSTNNLLTGYSRKMLHKERK